VCWPGKGSAEEERGRVSSMADDVAVVVVTYDALPWIEHCLESVRGVPTVVVDNGSSDGTVDFVRDRFPEVRLIESENRGLAAGWNVGLRETDSRYVLILNADAWLVGDALSRLVEAADERPRAAVVGPRLSNPDGTLQRSVRGFPTLWRLTTEYFFLRKLAPGTTALNAFYAGGFGHDEVREVEVVMGSCMLVRRDAVREAGTLDEDFFLFSEETDWCYRFREAGWQVVFFPGAECVHVGGASHGGRLYRENLRGHLRFIAKHHGLREARHARRLLLVALRLRALIFRGERGATYREAADWLASGDVATLLTNE
jgi:N-acetylglucosaminyl-diphospho-decaprenol L-rhamnosyltransferase